MNTTFVEALRRRAEATPDRPALEFQVSGTECHTVGYADLDQGARTVAALIQERVGPGGRVLLLHQPGPDYVRAFFGCLYAGAVAVPVYPPLGRRGLERVRSVAADSGAELALVDTATLAAIDERGGRPAALSSLVWATTDDADPALAAAWRERRPGPEALAFLQYTSGSTGTPKGVMLSHANLVHNSATIGRALGLDETSRGVSWLPPYHDMGLIGGILQPVYTGFPCTLLSPLDFLHKPLRWLQALSRTRATITPAPDFAYAEAVNRTTPEEREGLDLSALRHALVGSEPVRRSTLDAFAEAFRDTGFRRSAFYPCYGLAEATLFVTGGARPEAEPVTLHVDRADLGSGRVTVADGGPGAEHTACGWANHEDLALIVDPGTGRPLPPDTVGEVWVSGPTVALGYWRRPEETAATFGATAEGHPGRAFLRTGDLGFKHGEELCVTGRIKDLIIVRGRNHYPPDLELTAERAHPLLQPGRGAAFALDDGTAEKVVLVHEVRPRCTSADGPAVIAAVREAVAAEHGVALSDVVLVRLGSIPRTSSGKVRRTECRERRLAGGLTVVAAAGETPAGRDPAVPGDLAALIAAALETGPSELAMDASLVAQGLDSLRAVRLVAALEETYGVTVAPARLLDGLTPLDLARLREEPPAERSGESTRAPSATPAQKRMWLLDEMGAGSAYNVAGGLRLAGALDPPLLERCLAGLFADVPMLRTVFGAGDDGTLNLSVRPPAGEFRLPLRDFSRLGEERAREALREFAAEPFDLSAGPPVRLLLLKLGPEEWLLGLAAHHIALDGWSMGLLLRRLGDSYRDGGAAAVPAPMPVHPPRVPGEDGREFWRAQLDGAQAVDLPPDRPVPATPTWRGASLPVRLPAGLAERLRATAAECGATPFMVLLAAFGLVLGRWSGQDDLVIGTAVSGRDRPGNTSAIGMVTETLPIRVETGAAGFGAVVERVRARCLAAYGRPDLPFDEIVRAVAGRPVGGRASLVRTMLVLQNLPIEPWEARGVRAEPFELPAPGAQFELSVHLSVAPDGSLTGHAVYAADLFEERTIAGLLSGLPVLLDAALAAPATPVTELPVVPPAEADRIARTVADGGPPAIGDGLVHELIGRAARATPGAAAVVWDGGSLSYMDLDGRARALAAELRSRGVAPDQPVAVCLPRSPELVVTLYAVLLAGGAYLPLDPSHPPARRLQQIGDAGAKVLIGSARGLDLPEDVATVEPYGHTRSFAPAAVRPGHLANVLYTSGSTGRPKAVMTTHAALANRLVWLQRVFALEPGEAVLHKTPVTFDVAGTELLWPLLAGATVVLTRPDGHRDPYYLADMIVRHNVTTCDFVSSMLHAFLEEPDAVRCARTLRRVMCSGEELIPAVAERFGELLPGVELYNMYGPTEAAIEVTAHPVGADRANRTRIPIGRAMAGACLYVLDSSGRIAPPLATGELHIGGICPARGYLGRPALTAERFVPDPYHPGARLYRTGDRARMLPDGTFEYLGRLDRQLKIRGQRVEPAEVEAALNRHPLVGASVVEARPDVEGRLRLLAWVVPAGAEAPAPAALRGHLEERLPAGLVPDVITMLAELPVGAHGKLDRGALPDPAAAPAPAEERVAPRNAVERRIAGIWSDILGRPDLSVTADFFELGGHSLMATRVAIRVRAAFGVELPAGELLGGSLTIKRLAALVQERQLAQALPEEVGAVLDWLSELTDEQVSALLSRELDG